MSKFCGNVIVLMLSLLFLIIAGSTQTSAFVLFKLAGTERVFWNDSAESIIIPWSVEKGAPAILRDSMLYATKAWATASNNQIQFIESLGGLNVEWDSTGAKLNDPFTLATTSMIIDATGKINRANIVINASRFVFQRNGIRGVGSASQGQKCTADLDAIILHEIGHTLGINHSDLARDLILGDCTHGQLPTMNSVIFPGAETLHFDDESAVATLCEQSCSKLPEQVGVSASPNSGKKPLTVALTALGAADDAVWDFGDGTVGMGASLTHKFTTPGIYNVTIHANGTVGTTVVEVLKKAKKVKKVKIPRAAK
jgi:hypothetical protein